MLGSVALAIKPANRHTDTEATPCCEVREMYKNSIRNSISCLYATDAKFNQQHVQRGKKYRGNHDLSVPVSSQIRAGAEFHGILINVETSRYLINKLCVAAFVCVCRLLPRGEFVIILIVDLSIFRVTQTTGNWFRSAWLTVSIWYDYKWLVKRSMWK